MSPTPSDPPQSIAALLHLLLINCICAASYTHQPADQVVGVGVVLLGSQLGRVELGGPQDLQHPLQGLGHGDRAALLGRVDDVDHLSTRGTAGSRKRTKEPSPRDLHAAVMEPRM